MQSPKTKVLSKLGFFRFMGRFKENAKKYF